MGDLGVFDPDLYANGDPRHGGLPLDLFAELRDERPCYWQPLDAEPMFVDGVWVVSRYADVVAVICATSSSEAKAVTAAESAARGQRNHSRLVSRRKTSSRVKSGNILGSGPWPPEGTKQREDGLPSPPIKNPAGSSGLSSGLSYGA